MPQHPCTLYVAGLSTGALEPDSLGSHTKSSTYLLALCLEAGG